MPGKERTLDWQTVLWKSIWLCLLRCC